MQVLDDDAQLLAELRGYPFLQDLIFRADIVHSDEQSSDETAAYKYIYLVNN